MDRRRFLQLSLLSGAQLLAFGRPARAATPLGPLAPAPGGRLDLPAGFHATLVQAAGGIGSDGRKIPGRFDGMTCRAGPGGTWVLLRNHEIGDASFLAAERQDGSGLADARVDDYSGVPEAVDGTMHGGVSRVTLDPRDLRRALRDKPATPVRDSRMLLVGTDTNCSGGAVPEGWVSCEESHRDGHGWAWLVPADAPGLGHHRRLDGWGRFRHEAIALGPDGAIYMTEDDKRGLLYRFVPAGADRYGAGRLEALVVPDRATMHQDGAEVVREGETFPVRWVAIPDPAATSRKCLEQGAELGATRFCRNEGITADPTGVWFASSLGGPRGAGQVWHLDTATGTLHLVRQVPVGGRGVLSMPDNLALAPWGDVLLAEDNYDAEDGIQGNFLRGMTRAGEVYPIARNPRMHGELAGDEFTGPCFSPDGTVLFVNLQGEADETWAITGPWPHAAG